MIAFLEKIADEILQLPGEKIKDTLILVPNRRAQLYLSNYISNKITTPIWLPEIMAINDFIFATAQLEAVDNLELLIKIYEVHKSIETKHPQDIDQFSSWAELLLSDFNDIDLYLAPVDKLFSYLSDVKKIATWELEPKKLSPQEKSYLKFYESLSTYYHKLNKLLLKEGIAYQGMAYRYLSQELSNISLDYSTIFIVGFNALTPSEQKIISILQTNYSTKIYWDIDHYYFDNKDHEAGLFLRNQLNNIKYDDISFIENNWEESTKNITIYGIDSNLGQVKLAAQLLNNTITSSNYAINETAVILADEELMIPMINSVPECISKFNLSMSFPLRLHPFAELINGVFNLFSDYFRRESKTKTIYYQYFTDFIRQSIITNFINKSDNNCTSTIFKDITSNNISRIDLNDDLLKNLSLQNSNLQTLLNCLNIKLSKPIDILDIILNLFTLLEKDIDIELDKLFLNHFSHILSKLKKVLLPLNEIKHINTLRIWVRRSLTQSSLPFSGEPLEGLQIMGMLETRTLDFKNIIILSVNEGILPHESPYQSFILFEVKREFGLPLPKDNDAISSYYFYRLLQRAENINLIYSKSNDGMHSGESSRFIKQIELELPPYNPNIKIKHLQVELSPIADDHIQNISVEKTNEILEQSIKYILNRGLSPSSLNNYKKCSYLFYLQKIVGIKKDTELEVDMAYNTQGNIIHETLENLYKDYVGLTIDIEEFNKQSARVKSIFKERLDQLFGSKNTESGKNFLTRVILEKFLSNFISAEKEYLKEHRQLTIIGTEEELTKSLNFTINEKTYQFNFRGSADRIDIANNQLRIVDYKTGNVEESHLKITANKTSDQWDKMFNDEYDKAFQLMMYAWMYWEHRGNYQGLQCGISALKKHSKYYPLSLYQKNHIEERDIKRFEADLITLVEEILNQEIPFTQRQDDRVCKSCDYNVICARV